MNQIKQFRTKHELSQRKLAELLQVNYRTVQHWEAGTRNPSYTTLELLKRLDEEISSTYGVKGKDEKN